MLKGNLIHPEILGILGTLGHGSKVLISDGNYPIQTRIGPKARCVYLNLSPGIPTVTQVLGALLTAMPLEAAQVMLPHDGSEPPIFAEFRSIIRESAGPVELEGLGRFAFYDAASGPDVGLGIHTAEARVYANILLTIGVVK
jgi:L-fucose mutarotase